MSSLLSTPPLSPSVIDLLCACPSINLSASNVTTFEAYRQDVQTKGQT